MLDLAGDTHPGEAGAEQRAGWPSARTIRALVVRDLLLGRHGPLDPRGVWLYGARIDGCLNLDGVRTATPLVLIYCHAPDVSLYRAHLPWLALTWMTTRRLRGDGLRLDDYLNLAGLHATDAGRDGVVRLIGGHIGGDLNCSGAQLTNNNGPALHADRLQVGGGVLLRGGFRATGAGELGAVRLLGAHITGNLECDGAELTSSDGPALHADGLQVGGGMFLRGGFRATSAGERGAVRLLGAHITGVLECTDGRVCLDGGPGLDLQDGQVGSLCLDRGFADSLDIRGLRYAGIPDGPAVTDWLRWFADPHLGYAAQPYQQLAAAHRAAGHESEARRILIAQQRDLHARGHLTRWQKVRHRTLGLTLGYGYQSWRALIGLLATLAIAITLALLAGAHGLAAHTKDSPTPGAHCSTIEQIGLGVDLAAPLINTGTRTRCNLDTHRRTGQVLTATSWLLQLSGWAFATLFIAGFTGIIRKQ